MASMGDNSRLWLDVPFAEKDEAKALGARWDPKVRSWWAPAGRGADLGRWVPLPVLLPGEDRDFGSGLFVDLVPSSCWFTNVRSCVSSRDWDRLRLMIYRRAGYRCEACGGERDSQAGVYLEAHERWAFVTGDVQVLKRLICLCTPCHEVTHFGLATVRGRDGLALAHLMRVNDWHRRTAQDQIDDAFRLWRIRSASDWTLDVTMLTAVGISVSKPLTPQERRRAAADILSSGRESVTAPEPEPATTPEPEDPQPDLEPQRHSVAPAGWYADPSIPWRWRWWDGSRWTEHTG